MSPRNRRTIVGLLFAALLALVTPAAASAVTDVVAFSGRLAMASQPSPEAPANTGFGWAHHITTSPAGSHPDTAPSFVVLFPAPFILNAQDFPTCTATAVDGQAVLSPDCQNAMVGSGTATMWAGSPGSPQSNSVREDLTVSILNGSPAGSSILLVLTSTPYAPIAIRNRVIAGTIAAEPGYAFAVRFTVPADLQNQLGLAIVLSDLDVTISGTPRPITVGGTRRDMSYLQVADCGESLSARQLTDFSTTPSSTVTSDAGIPCALGSFPDPDGFPTAPYTSPRVPSTDNEAGGKTTVPAITLRAGGASLGHVRLRRNGSFPLGGVNVICPVGVARPCPVGGTATYRRKTVASARLQLAAGAHSPLALKLTRAGARLLARKRSLPLTVKLEVATPAGTPIGSTVRKTLRLTLLRARR
jgi:hypothetical protein